MQNSIYENAILIDTSAIIALRDSRDAFHGAASDFFYSIQDPIWASTNLTAHEIYTRIRYGGASVDESLSQFDFVRTNGVHVLEMCTEDEHKARALLSKRKDKELSFHDALCAAIMIRFGIYKVFTFDSDFWSFGFEIMPGPVRSRDIK